MPLVTTLPVLPDLAFALLIAWRLYRPDMVAPWAGLPLGIVADILTGQPVGVSATVWPLALLALAINQPRFPFPYQPLDWALAAAALDRTTLVQGKTVSLRVALVCRPLFTKQTNTTPT